MTFLSHSYIPSGWIPLTFTAWGTASTELCFVKRI